MSVMSAQAPFVPPEQFEEYRLVRPLGHGAMGQVYLAHDTLLDRPVAIKFIAEGEPDEGARERFFVEARAIARLQHENVVAIYRVGEIRRRPYLVSEFVRGQGLDRLERPVPWQRVLQIGIGLSRGLAAAHRRGVLHRDIKPANAMLTEDGLVKLLDFGLAKLLDPGPAGAMMLGRVQAEPPKPLDQTVPAQNQAPRRPLRAAPELTVQGEVLGSPLYMAPELWRHEPASRQADIYSLGVLLYQLCAGEAPHRDATLEDLPRRAQQEDVPPLRSVAPQADERLAAIIDRCVSRAPSARFPSGDALREALEALEVLLGHEDRVLPAGNPYRGLQSFEAEHKDLFFGRAAEVRALVDRLRAETLVVVAGDSGVGKSSLCRAGVLTAVADGALSSSWQRRDIVRMVPGRHPLSSLCLALGHLLDGEGTGLPGLIDRLQREPEALAGELRRRRMRRRDAELLLFIDQLEELITVAGAEEAARFSEVVGELCTATPGVRVLGTARSDFLTRLSALPGLGREVSRALYLLTPMSADDLREAIVQPARRTGYHFESPAMVESLLSAAARAEGGLPVLQFTLMELWEARAKAQHVIPASALSAIGGVEGALARHADGVLQRLLPAQRLQARRILGKLITVEGTRARRTESELLGDRSRAGRTGEAGRVALAALVTGRLLLARATASEDGEESVYEIAHEALLTGWDTLRGWLVKDAELRLLRQRLERAAAEWTRLGSAPEALWSERQLREAEGLDPEDLLPREAAFLSASRRQLRQRRLWRGALLLGTPLLLALTYGGLALQERRGVERQVGRHLLAAQADLSEARGRNEALAGARREAFALFDARRQAEAEDAWDRVLPLQAEVEQAYGRAGESLETALLLDGQRRDARDLFAAVLYERALLLEQGRRLQQRDEVLRRLALYDQDGSYRGRWDAPGLLDVESTPPGAAILLDRSAANERQKQVLVPQGQLGVTPLHRAELPRGSYLLTLSAPGRVTVRYPVLLGRAEQLRLQVLLPTPAEVPEGFVYVPAGRFLFGSDADESMRREFLSTAPLHEVRTGPYLIARNETTFADWLAYLRDLPQEERLRRLPRAGTAGFHGALELRELPGGGFRLLLQPTIREYAARTGERIRYQGRQRRAEQDWLRFPVAGISFEDARAYVEWLDRSGRLAGARLCTEAEWERAARGADEREYPHGDRLDPEDADYDQTYGKEPLAFGPDEVGSHPASRSLFGLDDQVGNVFEWVENSLSDRKFATRGGAYYFGAKSNRSTNRQEAEPTLRNPTLGMRVCASYPRPR